MSDRFRVNENGVSWDQVAVVRADKGDDRTRELVRITGLVRGDDGVLVLRLPGVVLADFIVGAAEARALRDALIARVSPLPDDLIHRKTPVAVMIAGGYVETTYADGTSDVQPEFEEDDDGEESGEETTT